MDKEDAASISEDEEKEEEPPRKPTPGPMPEYQYSRDELVQIAETKPAKERPECLHKSFDTSDGLWDPERWFRSLSGGSREESPLTISDGRERRRPADLDRDVLGRNRKTSTSDPKERLKEERDGIVLSPQRRSFGTGCHVSQTTSSLVTGSSTSVFRQSSLTDYKDRDDRDRDRRVERRIGSGRIQIDRDQGRERERDYHVIRDRYDRDDRDRGDRDRDRDRSERDRMDRERDRIDRDRDRDRRFDDRPDRFRRSDSRDFGDKMAERRDRDFRDRDRDRDRFSRDDRGYNRHGRRRYNSVDDETPEWFTGGPTSQTDTIELRGFERDGERESHVEEEEFEDEAEEAAAPEGKKPRTAVNESGDAKDRASVEKSGEHGVNAGERSGSRETNESSSPEAPAEEGEVRPSFQPLPNNTSHFDFNQFFNLEHIPGLVDILQDPPVDLEAPGDSASAEAGSGGSRFSKWFQAQTAAANAMNHQQDRSNSNSTLGHNHRNSPVNISEDFHYLSDMVEGSRSPSNHSPPPPAGAQLFGERNLFHPFPLNHDGLTAGPDNHMQQKNLPPRVSALFQNSAAEKSGNASTPSSRGSFSNQDVEAQLKALLFGGARDSASSSGTASPANVPPGVQRKMKTVAELEADMHQNSPGRGQSPATTLHSTSAPIGSGPQPHRNDDGDQSAFNRLLNLMKAGGGAGTPPIPGMAEQRSMSPSFGTQAHNEFTQALLRNKEQQRQIQQIMMQNMQQSAVQQSQQVSQIQHQLQQMQQQQLQQQQLQHLQQQLQQQQHQPQGVMAKVPIIQHPPQAQQQVVAPRPVLSQGIGQVPRATQDPIRNFLQQNPTIVMKPPSPAPVTTLSGMMTGQGPIPSPLPPGLPPPSIRVTSQQGNNPAAARVPSPLMFSQQPPLHLSAPSPIHPSQLAPLAGQALSTNTLTTTSGMRSPVLQRVPSPQELVAHTQAILQNALIKRKLEDQKERYLKKQQERDKSPSQPAVSAANKMTAPAPASPATTQSKPANMAFTPTSVIRKMHSDRVTEKEKQNKENDEDSGDNQLSSKQHLQKQSSDSLDDSALGSGDTGLVEPSELHTPGSFNSNISAMSSQLEEGLRIGGPDDQHLSQHLNQHLHDSMDEKMFHSVPIPILGQNKGARPVVGQPVAPPPSMGSGRPIVKGTDVPGSAALPPQPRPLTGGAPLPVSESQKSEPRPIIGSSGGGFDISKLVEQQRLHHQQQQAQQAVLPPHMSTPIPRPVSGGSAPPIPFMPINPGRLPVPTATQTPMQSAMLMQINRVNALNQMNHMNHMNQMAALQAHQAQRMIDPRLQPLQPLRTVVPTVTPGAPLSPRSSVPTTGIPGLMVPASSSSVALKRAFSPAATKPAMNGPFTSIGAPVVSSAAATINNCRPSDGEILKWFSPEVLKTQMPSMPPLPTHSTKVMTVDEIERS